jgi:hypothetical protein
VELKIELTNPSVKFAGFLFQLSPEIFGGAKFNPKNKLEYYINMLRVS